ncbi:MAG: hypothetical protein KGN36_00320 [Acidobacteriota bacterium]|nr:hypothetical protein [Acidobacteriota bacterium]
MKTMWILPCVLLLTCAPAALAQRGRGAAMPTAHGAAPDFSNTAPRTTAPAPSPHASSHATAPSNTSVGDRVVSNPALATRIRPLLPTGASVQSAANGFRNQGQFLAALHVSHNLNIPFDQLKSRMTGSQPESLGKAIHDLRPEMNNSSVKKEVKTAQQQSSQDARRQPR